MIYTKQQINEIKKRLSVLGIKDTDMKELDLNKTPLSGKETVVIVKDNENVRVPVGSLIPVTMLEDVQLVTEDGEPCLYFIFKTSEGNKAISVKVGSLIAGLDVKMSELEEEVNSLKAKEQQDVRTINTELESLKAQVTSINSALTLIKNAEIPNLKNRCTSLETRVSVLESLIENIEFVGGQGDNPHRTLKDAPDAYLRNVHYDITTTGESLVRQYVNDSIKVNRLDQPNPIDLPYHATNFRKEAVASSGSINHIYRDGHTYVYNLIPGNRYFYLKDGDWKSLSLVGGRRFIYADKIKNVRDLGGIPTEGCGIIAYDKIFRGSEITGNVIHPQYDMQYLNWLGISLDMDLRDESEVDAEHKNSSPLNAYYTRIPFIRFEEFANMTEDTKVKIKQAFEAVANEVIRGGKVYIHCAWGFHRAGFLCSLIEGVLGAKQCEIDKDYELSSFSDLGYVTRDDDNYKNGIATLNTQYGGSWERVLRVCGVSQQLIDNFRNEMIVDVSKQQAVGGGYIEVTYEELVKLRNEGSLVPGAKYRMIDYDTLLPYDAAIASCSGIRDLPEAKSQHKYFDLVLTALSTTELDCNAKAVHSARDTENYFKDADLAKWEIKYDLNNDTSKYSFAANENIETRVVYDDKIIRVNNYYKFKRSSVAAAPCVIKYLGGFKIEVVKSARPEKLPLGVYNIEAHHDYLTILLDEETLILLYYDWMTEHYAFEEKKYEGKGVIYYMKDENNNEVPYDFKNILFKKNDSWVNTFSIESTSIEESKLRIDVTNGIDISTPTLRKWSYTGDAASVGCFFILPPVPVKVTNTGDSPIEVGSASTILEPAHSMIYNPIASFFYVWPHDSVFLAFEVSEIEERPIIYTYTEAPATNNTIKPWIDAGVQNLNNNLILCNSEENVVDNNFFDNNAHDNTIEGDAINCKIGKYCYYNRLINAENSVLGDDCVNIRTNRAENFYVGNGCYNLTFSRASANVWLKVDDLIHDDSISVYNEHQHIINANEREEPYRWLMTESTFNNIMR